MCDINGLKLVNDTLGHAAGDKLLIKTAKLLSVYSRKKDIVARIGGDEFCILLPLTNNNEAERIMERITSGLKKCKVDLYKEKFLLSLSLGCATRTTLTQLYKNVQKIAEDNMYRKKLLERNSFHNSLLESLKTSLLERSRETEEHAERLVFLSKKIGRAMKLNEEKLDELELLSKLHDIGKMGIDTNILTKHGKLSEVEWLEMKRHTGIGYRIAMASSYLQPIAEYILSHHERWDGKGYPQGLKKDEIPLLSRILFVVDAYDAITNDRPYRKALSKEVALAEIEKNSGTQFDPEIATLFIKIMKTS
jgi:diguanylate cyclase (GGDEF)-like protein